MAKGKPDPDDLPEDGEEVALPSTATTRASGTETMAGRQRSNETEDCELDPATLVGSWFHKIDTRDGEVMEQGLVVAEIYPGPPYPAYLLNLYGFGDGRLPLYQKAVPLNKLFDDENYEWRFYDTDDDMRAALVESLREVKETE